MDTSARQGADDGGLTDGFAVGFTAVVCRGTACGTEHGDTAVRVLGECVRHHPHAMLISMGCLLGRIGCRALTTNGQRRAGSLLAVQPCRADRSPVGPAVWIGPLASAEDVAEVCQWLYAGDLRPIALPARLHWLGQVAGNRGATN